MNHDHAAKIHTFGSQAPAQTLATPPRSCRSAWTGAFAASARFATPKPWQRPRTCPQPIGAGRSAPRQAPSGRRSGIGDTPIPCRDRRAGQAPHPRPRGSTTLGETAPLQTVPTAPYAGIDLPWIRSDPRSRDTFPPAAIPAAPGQRHRRQPHRAAPRRDPTERRDTPDARRNATPAPRPRRRRQRDTGPASSGCITQACHGRRCPLRNSHAILSAVSHTSACALPDS